MKTDNILGVNIAVTDMDEVVSDILSDLDGKRGKYICVSNVHTVVMAHDDKSFMDIQNGALMALPDGMPLSAHSRKAGYAEAERVTGPDLMKRLLIISGRNMSQGRRLRHFFYGSDRETIDKLAQVIADRYPEAEIAGMISPPYRELTCSEDEEHIRLINEASPDFIWVGLGAPKQERWMSQHKDKVSGLMIGVGAAFDYEAGNIKRAPVWMQKCSLEWLYRLMQDPGRLFKRYFVTNLKYMWLTRK